MNVSGEYTFDATPEAVWTGLLDPEVLAATMPGCERLELVGEHRYEGALDIKVGPVQGKFQGKIRLEDLEPPTGFRMLVEGQGAPGFVRASAEIAIQPDGDRTKLVYDGDAQVGGRVASVGQRLLESSAKAIIRQSLEGLNQTLTHRQALADGAGAADAVTPDAAAAPAAPSQAEFATKVAAEVAKDLLPRPVLYGIIVLLVVLVILLLIF